LVEIINEVRDFNNLEGIEPGYSNIRVKEISLLWKKNEEMSIAGVISSEVLRLGCSDLL